jgi:putative aldouronate transport system permease protein
MATIEASKSSSGKMVRGLIFYLKKDKYLYMMLIPGIILTITLRYIPMYGIIMAFEKYRVADGIWGSKWIGLDNFKEFFKDPYSMVLIKNTFLLGIFTLIFGFPVPIILALIVNEVMSSRIKSVIQSILYLPHFVSTVIIIGILRELLTLDNGLINQIITFFGGNQINFFAESGWFRFLYVFSGIWQDAGFGSIIFLAAIIGINPELYESATIDGSSRFKNMIYITIPCIMPTIIIMFILAIGGIMGNDFQKILLVYSGPTYDTADVLQTYIYRLGIEGGQYGLTAAVGIFNSVFSFLFLYFANLLARKAGGNSLW